MNSHLPTIEHMRRVYNFISYGEIDWVGIGAAATLIVLPVSVFAFFVRNSIVQGLTMGVPKD